MNIRKRPKPSKDITIDLIMHDCGYTAITDSYRAEYDDKGNKRVVIGKLIEATTKINIIDKRTPPPTCPFKLIIKKAKIFFNRFK
ncbi:hypothetical protein [Yersinia bercovieri]|uniref:hypothetical protein n=1 Tax=Yersinia bercovieri TaxID=634 RepID=UPI0011A1D70B|nr:hypothetical protein [Yersinia bercovieri]